MKIDNTLIDILLYGEEGYDLDFKRDQYKFTLASDDEKGELIKDILAFANSWRRTDAFVLIGIQEVKGQRSKVVGITETLDDAQMQQFVNSKTNTPISFSYQNIDFEGKPIGIIHIPCQTRPFYLKRNYGRLKKETIYIKRGSSTDIAKLDEIAKMGASAFAVEENHPALEIFFADVHNRKILSDAHQTSSLLLNTPKSSDIPDYSLPRSNQPSWMHFEIEQANPSYYRELTSFIKEYSFYSSIYFAIKNTGTTVAKDVRVEFKIMDQNNEIKAFDKSTIIKVPESSYSTLNLHQPVFSSNFFSEPKQFLNVKRISNYWLIEAGVEKVQPKSTTWLNSTLFVGASKSIDFPIETVVFSDDLPEPSNKNLLIKNITSSKDVSLKDIKVMEHERWKKTPEGQKFMERHREQLQQSKDLTI